MSRLMQRDFRLHYPVPFARSANPIARDQFAHCALVSLSERFVLHLRLAGAAIGVVPRAPRIRLNDHGTLWKAGSAVPHHYPMFLDGAFQRLERHVIALASLRRGV